VVREAQELAPPSRLDQTGLSRRNRRVQRVRRLLRSRSDRAAERAFVVEGAKLVAAALDSGAAVQAVYCRPGAVDAQVVGQAERAGARVEVLAPGVMERVADVATPQAVLAVVGFVDVGLDSLAPASLVVVCAGVRDPGNLGTILRSAAAAGADGVVCCEGTVDVYNPKVVRSSAGALFQVPVAVAGDAGQVLDRLGEWGLSRLAGVVRGGRDHTSVDLSRPCAFVLGNEAGGLPGRLLDMADDQVTVQMPGGAESLNVAMAATLLCFEAARQRRGKTPVRRAAAP
jgi:TrmH family RNA methyltransferase